MMVDLHVIERSNFIRDAKTLVRTLDKINNTRPIIKIFLFPYIECTERTMYFFFQFRKPFFYFFPHTKMLDTPKCFFPTGIGKLRSFYKYIKRLLLGSKNEKKKKKKKKKRKNFKELKK